MIEEKEINTKFVQNGPICVLASYGIIIDYFSIAGITPDKLLDAYRKYFPELDAKIKKQANKIKRGKFKNKLCDNISDHFHQQCYPTDKRGFKFIKELHENDILNTKDYCAIDDYKADKTFIDFIVKEKLKNLLINTDKIAMVLYNVKDTLYHAVVIWFNDEKKQFAIRDPEKSKLIYCDSFISENISEYIVFSAIEEDVQDDKK